MIFKVRYLYVLVLCYQAKHTFQNLLKDIESHKFLLIFFWAQKSKFTEDQVSNNVAIVPGEKIASIFVRHLMQSIFSAGSRSSHGSEHPTKWTRWFMHQREEIPAQIPACDQKTPGHPKVLHLWLGDYNAALSPPLCEWEVRTPSTEQVLLAPSHLLCIFLSAELLY